MSRKKKQNTPYTFQSRLTPKEKLEHFEHMAKFWEKAGHKPTAGQYTNKAKKLREELGLVT